MTEQRLPGGRSFGAVRVGGEVRRPAQPWTATVHSVLRHLEGVGFDGAPRARGFDDQGRERLTFIPGQTLGETSPWPDWLRSGDALGQVGAWLRRLHDATASFRPAAGAVWFTGRAWQPGLVIAHLDASPWNAVWVGGALAGFVDWDTAGPSRREDDLAFSALTWNGPAARSPGYRTSSGGDRAAIQALRGPCDVGGRIQLRRDALTLLGSDARGKPGRPGRRADAPAGDHVTMRHSHQQYREGEMVLVIDCSDLERSAAFWCDVLGYRRDGPPVGQYLGLFPAQGTGLQLLLQRVEDPKPAKNRLHLDLRTRELGPEVERIRAAGGVVVTEEPAAEFGFRWQILADPDGNELCVVEPPSGHWQA